MTVEEIMHPVTTVEPEMSVFEAAKLMSSRDIGSVLVRLGSCKYGVVTERDMLKKVTAEAKNPKQMKVSEIMTALQYTVNHDASEEEASELFNKYPVRRLVVVKNDDVVGIITSRDIAKRLAFKRIRKHRLHSSGHEFRG